MALITFAPNGLALTNGNLTGTADYSYPLKANQSKSSGKWYWEIKYNSGSYPMIGVAGISTGAGATWTGNLGRYYYVNGNKYPGPIAYGSAMVIGDIIGVAIDLDSPTKTIKFYKNGIPQGIAFSDLHLLEKPMVPYITAGGSGYNNNVTANFGAYTFDIMARNATEWEKLMSDGYLPYDIENSFVAVPNISVDKLVIKSVNEKISLNLDSIKFGTNLDSVKITINDKTIHDGQVMLPLPNNIVLQLNSSFITQSVNPMKIYANGNILVKTLNIYHETSLLNPLVRDFKNTKVDNMKLSIDTGTSLNNVLEGNVLLNIPTEMRSKVNKITVDSDSDKILNTNGMYPLTNIDQYLYKTPIVLNPGNRLVSTDYLGIKDILYMKAPVEFPTDFNLTDGNDITGIAVSRFSPPFTFILDKPYNIISNRAFSSGSTIPSNRTYNENFFKYYDENDVLLYENYVNGAANTINTHGIIYRVKKITILSRSMDTTILYAVNINGYPDNISNLYYTQKYYMYSRLGYFVSRFILEYTPSPIDSTLVKSKKMGNLAFINNSSKVVVKKYDSSIDNPSSKIVRSKIVLSNKIPIRRIEIK